jgi:hypothetical protein
MKKLFLVAVCCMLANLVTAQNQENLKIIWPEEYKWKIAANHEDKNTHQMQLVPGNQDTTNWTILGSMTSVKNIKVAGTAKVIEIFKDASLQESPKAKLTELEKDDKAKHPWVIFKVETPSFPNDPMPESQLY